MAAAADDCCCSGDERNVRRRLLRVLSVGLAEELAQRLLLVRNARAKEAPRHNFLRSREFLHIIPPPVLAAQKKTPLITVLLRPELLFHLKRFIIRSFLLFDCPFLLNQVRLIIFCFLKEHSRGNLLIFNQSRRFRYRMWILKRFERLHMT